MEEVREKFYSDEVGVDGSFRPLQYETGETELKGSGLKREVCWLGEEIVEALGGAGQLKVYELQFDRFGIEEEWADKIRESLKGKGSDPRQLEVHVPSEDKNLRILPDRLGDSGRWLRKGAEEGEAVIAKVRLDENCVKWPGNRELLKEIRKRVLRSNEGYQKVGFDLYLDRLLVVGPKGFALVPVLSRSGTGGEGPGRQLPLKEGLVKTREVRDLVNDILGSSLALVVKTDWDLRPFVMATSREQTRQGRLLAAGDPDKGGLHESWRIPRFLAGPKTIHEGVRQVRNRLREIAPFEEALNQKTT